jgi:hypothetical protein
MRQLVRTFIAKFRVMAPLWKRKRGHKSIVPPARSARQGAVAKIAALAERVGTEAARLEVVSVVVFEPVWELVFELVWEVVLEGISMVLPCREGAENSRSNSVTWPVKQGVYG